MPKNHTTGIYFASIAALISGVSIFVNKFAVDAVRQPLLLTSLKNSGVAVLILGILLAGGKWRQIKRLSRHELIYLIAIGVIGGSIPFYLFFTGLSAIPAINGAIIQKTLVIWVALLAFPFLKEKLSVKGIFGIILLFSANIFVGGFFGFKFSPGETLVLVATLFWAVEIILAKKILPTVDPDILTAARMGFGAIILLSLTNSSISQITKFSPAQFAWIGLTATLLLIYVTVWYRALKFVPAVTVTAILVASTLVTNALSAIFITHSFNSHLILQSLLIVIGLKVLFDAEVFKPQLSVLPRSSKPN